MFSYDEFKAKIKSDGLAKQNRFFVTITLPSAIQANAPKYSGTALRDIHLLCKSINIPGVNISTNPIRTTGEQYEVPYDRAFSSANFSFYVDRAMIVREFFDDWVNFTQNTQTRLLSWFDDYISPNIQIVIQDKMSKATYLIVLYECLIKSIGAFSLDQGANDPMVLDVSIDYHYYATWNYLTPVGSVQGGVSGNDIVSSISDYAPALYSPMTDFASLISTTGYYENFNQFQDQYSQELAVLYDANQQVQSAIGQIQNAISNTASSFVG